jgi:CHAT domain-containing protein
MDEQRQRAYLRLIHALLTCPSDEEPNILRANQDLIDAGLIQTMEQVAETLSDQGDQNTANWLKNFAGTLAAQLGLIKNATGEWVSEIVILRELAGQLAAGMSGSTAPAEESISFLMEVMQAASNGEIPPEAVKLLILATLEKLGDNFPESLRSWATAKLGEVPPSQSVAIAREIVSLIASIHYHFGMMNDRYLEIAIASYESVMQIITRDAFPLQWGDIQNNLGACYGERTLGEKAENQERAIASLKNALQVYTYEAFPEDWGLLQSNLGNLYVERIRGDKTENLEEAIAYCQSALLIRTPSAFPVEWAATQVNLSYAYLHRIRGNRAENLEEVIACCQRALQIYKPEFFSERWAKAQANLASAYLHRIFGDEAENREEAIACARKALQVLTAENSPKQWGKVQTNLGDTYRERVLGIRTENIAQAIACHQNALLVFNPRDFPEEWATVQMHLGVVYQDQAQERGWGDKAENLEQAIACHQNALLVFTYEDFPQSWAMTQMNLGSAYQERICGEQAKNLEDAIACYQTALSVYSREVFPEEWGKAQNNLGRAYRKLQKIPEAIQSFRSALEIHTPTITFPEDCFRAGRQLGNIAFTAGQWTTAVEGYAYAIDALERLRSWTISESRRQLIVGRTIEVYENMVQACVNIGQLEKAFEYAERSRAKRLVDLMASNDLHQGGEFSPEIQELLQKYEAKQREIDKIRLGKNLENNRKQMGTGASSGTKAAIEAYNEDTERLEAQKQQIWEELRKSDFVLTAQKQVSAPNFDEMKQLIDQPTTAILSFYTTGNDTHIFVLRKNQITLHTCTGQGLATLLPWIFRNWFNTYIDIDSSDRSKTKEEREQQIALWISQFNPFLTELKDRLQLNDLIAQHLGGIKELILVPHLLLHQIPFAALPIENGQLLGDKFLIRYAPSCQVLEFCNKREPVEGIFSYGTVEDATDDLPIASFECEQIAQLYNIPDRLRLKGGSQATVQNYRQLVQGQKVQVLHSSHHASSRLDEPLESLLKLGNGYITLGELLTPGWRLPDLVEVFLSCCETNLGLAQITDDILTIGFGFLCAGARSVVSTLWSVDELATALFCIFYYQYRPQNLSRPQALKKAQEELRTLTGNTFSTVYKPKLEPILEEKFNQAYATQQEAKRTRDRYQKDSEEYKQWHQEYTRRKNWSKHLLESKQRLENLSKKSLPFSHPFYWAAFTCSGLR